MPTGHFDTDFAEEGSFVTNDHGTVGRLNGGIVVTYEPRVAKDQGQLSRLVGLRDAARAVLAVQVEGGSEGDLHAAQQLLRDRYQAYALVYGPINRSSQARTGRRDQGTGAEIMRRVRPRMGGFRDDPDWPLVAALEVFDDDTQEARPAAIFTERVIDPPRQRLGVDTPDEAVAFCLDENGTVTLDRAAELLGTDTDSARQRLGDLVYEDPATRALVPASQYLSGNIRQKLAAAEHAVGEHPRLKVNALALKRVLPRQLEPGEITARLGVPWIAPPDIEAFCREVLAAAGVRVAGWDPVHRPQEERREADGPTTAHETHCGSCRCGARARRRSRSPTPTSGSSTARSSARLRCSWYGTLADGSPRPRRLACANPLTSPECHSCVNRRLDSLRCRPTRAILLYALPYRRMQLYTA